MQVSHPGKAEGGEHHKEVVPSRRLGWPDLRPAERPRMRPEVFSQEKSWVGQHVLKRPVVLNL